MPVCVYSAVALGLEGKVIRVETDITRGLPSFTIVGLADTAVQEARERVRSAIKNSGYRFPANHKTVSLAPANIRKHGPAFDLPMALGLLAADAQIKTNIFGAKMILGELSLDGSVRGIPGIIQIIRHAAQNGYEEVIISPENADTAGLVRDIRIIPVRSLRETIDYLQGKITIAPLSPVEKNRELPKQIRENSNPFSGIVGQWKAKRALQISAAGHHCILFSGPPGIGKTLLAHTISALLPPLNDEQMLEVLSLYSLRQKSPAISLTPPVREVHHSTSHIALIGGTSELLPGELSLAHHGALILDEMSEFPRGVLESLRQPLEEQKVHIVRAQGAVTYPAKVLLIGTTNPCPCGYLGDPKIKCTCTDHAVEVYQRRISGPLLDRIDIRVTMERVSAQEMLHRTPAAQKNTAPSETNADETANADEISIVEKIIRARTRQRIRFHATTYNTNSDIAHDMIEKFCIRENAANTLLQHAAESLHLSARAIARIIKVARTIADLEDIEAEKIGTAHVAEAIQFR